MALEFEWDPAKADANARKHRVAFSEAMTAFADPLGGEQGIDCPRQLLALDARILGHGLESGWWQRLGRGWRALATAGEEQGWQHGGEEAREEVARHRRAVLPPGLGRWQPQSEP